MKPYPDHVCSDCAEQVGGRLGSRAADWRVRRCDVCNKHVLVVSPADYNWPRFAGYEPHVTICPPRWAWGALISRVTAKSKGRRGLGTG